MNKDESPPILTDDRNVLIFWEDIQPNGQHVGQFDTVLMVRVEVPGDNKSAPVYMVETTYPADHPHPIFGKVRKNDLIWQRYGKYIEKYKGAQSSGVMAGTPIEAWPLVTRAQVAMLKHNCVYSVEMLATLTDAQIPALGPEARKLVQQAKDYLANAQNAQAAAEAQARNDQIQAQFAAMKEQMDGLAEAMEALPPEAKEQVKATLAKRNAKPKAAA